MFNIERDGQLIPEPRRVSGEWLTDEGQLMDLSLITARTVTKIGLA